MITTAQVAKFVNKSPNVVRWLAKNDPFFPEPERSRGGTLFHFDLRAIERWMSNRGIAPQCDRATLLDSNANLLTTSEVLKRLHLKDGKGNRNHLAQKVRAGDFPRPVLSRRGKQGQNLWSKQEVEQHIAQGVGYTKSRATRRT